MLADADVTTRAYSTAKKRHCPCCAASDPKQHPCHDIDAWANMPQTLNAYNSSLLSVMAAASWPQPREP